MSAPLLHGVGMIALAVVTAVSTRLGVAPLVEPGERSKTTGTVSAAPITTPTARPRSTVRPSLSPATRPLPAQPSPTPMPVDVQDLLIALQRQPLSPVLGYESVPAQGPSEYVPPGDTVPSARLVGGIEYALPTSEQTSVFAQIVLFEDARDATVDLDAELVAAEAGGDPYVASQAGSTTVHCSSDGLACVAQIGRASLRSAGGEATFDSDAVRPMLLAAIQTLASAREQAKRG